MVKTMKQLVLMIVTTVLFLGCNVTPNQVENRSQKDEFIINSDSTLQSGWYNIVDIDNGFERQLDMDTIFYFIDPKPIVRAKNITILEIYESNDGDLGLSMQFNEEGTNAWSEGTKKAIGKKLAFILDNELVYVPIVRSQVTSGMAAINRNYKRHELENIKRLIEWGKE
jgi:preprotein translocase subunit SecD